MTYAVSSEMLYWSKWRRMSLKVTEVWENKNIWVRYLNVFNQWHTVQACWSDEPDI